MNRTKTSIEFDKKKKKTIKETYGLARKRLEEEI